MTSLVGIEPQAKSRAIERFLLLPLTIATVTLSAFLLFAVQPMFAKMVLPRLGGASGVWSVAMVFFQAALLCGYAFAHLITRRLPLRQAILLQVVVMLAAFFCLPISLSTMLGAPPSEGAPLWILGLFTISIGLPFFALSAIGPLLQAWFARSANEGADDPYFLYAASNIGSFAALLSYPIVIEPLLRLTTQSALWTVGYGLLVVLVGSSGLVVLKLHRGQVGSRAGAAEAARSTVGLRQRAVWTTLAFAPSALLVAVTAQITSDVAAIPFLWVLPLALFLMTFVITFGRKPAWLLHVMSLLQPVLVGALAVSGFIGISGGIFIQIFLHLAVLFVTAMVCHGELVRRRPDAEHLTEFYMYMSLGGVLGGLFAGLIAPAVFSTVAEYPILLVVGLALPALLMREGSVARDILFGAALGGGAVLVSTLMPQAANLAAYVTLGLLSALLAAVIVWRRTVLRVAALCAVLFAFHTENSGLARTVSSERSFFGVHRVGITPDGRFRVLFHGSTLHGAEEIRPAGSAQAAAPPVPVSYFHPGGAYDRAVRSLRDAGNTHRVAVTGLGAGVLACYRQSGENWAFFEIDPLVIDIARRDFSYLRECAPDARIVLGDARLTLAAEPAQSFDLIIKDAFTSDSIPVHLITTDALRLYLSRISDHGAILLHISNRYVEMQSVLARAAAELGLVLYVSNRDGERFDPVRFHARADIAVLARAPEHLGPLANDPRWSRVLPDPNVAAWTDDYSNVLAALWRRVVDGR